MKRVLKKYIVSHEGNDHRPYLLREKGALALAGIVIIFFAFAEMHAYFIRTSAPAAVVNAVVVDLVNQDRLHRGLGTLTVSQTLTEAAQLKANDMAKKGYFSHVGPDNTTSWYWFSLVNYNFMYAGENLAVNFSESSDVETAWMNSTGHRDNILNSKFTEIGVATAQGVYNGQPTTFVVQMFGRPMSGTTLAKVTPQKKSEYYVKQPKTLAVASTTSAKREDIKVTQVKDMYIAFEDTSATRPVSTNVASQTPTSRYSTFFGRLLLQPKHVLVVAYGVLAALILTVFGFILVGEIKRHHATMAVYGFSLIIGMLTLAYLYSSSLVAMVQIM